MPHGGEALCRAVGATVRARREMAALLCPERRETRLGSAPTCALGSRFQFSRTLAPTFIASVPSAKSRAEPSARLLFSP